MSAALPAIGIDGEEAVERFLRANPGWLAANPDLYRILAPPLRVHGEVLSDHMAAMITRERQHGIAMAERHDGVIAAGRAASNLLARIQEAVLALIAADDTIDCIAIELPRILGMDAATLCRRSHVPVQDDQAARLERLMGTEDVICRTAPADALALYAEAAPLAAHDLLIRVPAIGVLGLASRDPQEAGLRFGRQHLRFLGATLAAILVAKTGAAPPSVRA